VNAMAEEFITIVSGLPRSGTSMMMQMLEAGGMPVLVDSVRQTDEDNPRGYYEFEPVKKTADDPSWLDRAAGKAVKMVYRLLYDLPKDHTYRVVLMQRDLGEVVASQERMLARQAGGGDGLAPARAAELFRSELRRFELWAARQPHLAVFTVNYADAIADARREAGRVAAFLGGGLDAAAMAAAVDPALYRNRR